MPVSNKSRILAVRMTPAQEALVKNCADAQGIRVSDFARFALVRIAQQRLVAMAGAATAGVELQGQE